MTDNGTWDRLVAMGIDAYEAKDRAHFTLGQLASEVETVYGDDSLGNYARDINAERARLYEYRSVWNFYAFSAVAEYYDRFANLRYSHYRDAMRFRDRDKALAFLAHASDDGLLVEQARVEIAQRMGKPVTGRKVWEGECYVNYYTSEAVITPTDGTALPVYGGRYIVKVYALPDTPPASGSATA